MKYAILFLLSLALAAWANGTEAPSQPKVTGIFEYPTILHKCSATYLSKQWVLTAASCALCLHKCKLQVKDFRGLSDFSAPIYDILETKVHPNYLFSPKLYNIALVKVQEATHNPVIFTVADSTPDDTKGSIAFYQMSSDLKTYNLVDGEATTASLSECPSIQAQNETAPEIKVCLKAKGVTLGQFDLGTSFVTTQNGQNLIVGLHDQTEYIENAEAVPFLNVSHIKPWIDSIIAQ